MSQKPHFLSTSEAYETELAEVVQMYGVDVDSYKLEGQLRLLPHKLLQSQWDLILQSLESVIWSPFINPLIAPAKLF